MPVVFSLDDTSLAMKLVSREEIKKACPFQVSWINQLKKDFGSIEITGIANRALRIYWVPEK